MSSSVSSLIDRIKSADDAVSGAAWQSAGPYGAAAVKPLTELMADTDFELSRKGKRALYKVVRHVGHPAAVKERRAVESELIKALKSNPTAVRRDITWMLSEIGSDRAVPALAALLADREVREDARCALMRHPARAAVNALKKAFTSADEQFKFALAESLRARGDEVEGYPSRKLTPTAKTQVATEPAK